MEIKKRIVVLASGRGSNFQAIATAVRSGKINATIAALVTNNPQAAAIAIAKEHGIPTIVLNSKKFRRDGKFHRSEYEVELLKELKQLSPDWICLAGYMLLLGKKIIEEFPLKIINIHPSLLPKFKGLNAHQQALDAKVAETGCTVHFVTEEMDAGPILTQAEIKVGAGETVETLTTRLLPLEHQTYVEALTSLCSKKFKIAAGRVLFE